MEAADLHARLMDDARRYDPSDYHRGLLAPYRDVLLLWRAKFMSYEQIAATLIKHGLKVSPAGIGRFCRQNFTKAEILRERKRVSDELGRRPAATIPSSGGLSTVAKPAVVPVLPGRRGPRIARDNY